MPTLRDRLWLRELREKHGWTQADLARASGVKRGSIEALERGRIDSCIASMARALAAALEVEVADLFDPPTERHPAGHVDEWGPG